jgi:hypothetical protein
MDKALSEDLWQIASDTIDISEMGPCILKILARPLTREDEYSRPWRAGAGRIK